jgi:TatD DNase family protein
LKLPKKENITVPILIHGFSKSEQLAKQLLDSGFYISFGKYLLRNPELEFVFKNMPNDRFFLETDTIDEGIQAVYALAAKYKGVSKEEIQEIIRTNFNKVFKIKF